jgi:hypothetical protein
LICFILLLVLERIKVTQNLEQLLLKDACYAALGLGFWEFYELVPFSTWFQNVLRVELTIRDKAYVSLHFISKSRQNVQNKKKL